MLYPLRHGTRCIRSWLGARAILDGGGIYIFPTGIRSPDLPARSKPLYRLLCPRPNIQSTVVNLFLIAVGRPIFKVADSL